MFSHEAIYNLGRGDGRILIITFLSVVTDVYRLMFLAGRSSEGPLRGLRGSRGPPKVQTIKICCGLFRTELRLSDRRQYTGSLL